MTASLTTLSATDRRIVTAPRNCYEVVHKMHNFGDNIDIAARNFNGKKVINAIRVGGDCFDVTLQNFNHQFGKLAKGKTIRFTTTEAWLNAWLDAVQSAV